MTSRNRRVSAVAASMRSGRAYSRTMARMASTCWSTSASGMCCMSGVCSISRHRLSAAPATAGKPNVPASPLMSWAARNRMSWRLLGEAVALDVLPRSFKPVALGLHPAGEFARQLRQCRFGARHGIVDDVAGRRQNLAQLVRRRDHLVVGVGRDRRGVVFTTGHLVKLHRSWSSDVTRAFSSSGCWRTTSALPPLRRSGPT